MTTDFYGRDRERLPDHRRLRSDRRASCVPSQVSAMRCDPSKEAFEDSETRVVHPDERASKGVVIVREGGIDRVNSSYPQ